MSRIITSPPDLISTPLFQLIRLSNDLIFTPTRPSLSTSLAAASCTNLLLFISSYRPDETVPRHTNSSCGSLCAPRLTPPVPSFTLALLAIKVVMGTKKLCEGKCENLNAKFLFTWVFILPQIIKWNNGRYSYWNIKNKFYRALKHK